MAVPAHTAVLLQRAGLFDLVVGTALAVYAFSTTRATSVGVIGVFLAVTGLGMFLWARSQRPEPEGPIRS